MTFLLLQNMNVVYILTTPRENYKKYIAVENSTKTNILSLVTLTTLHCAVSSKKEVSTKFKSALIKTTYTARRKNCNRKQ